MNNRDRRVIVEDIVAVAIWDPQDADPCNAQEKLRARWEFATANARFHYRTSTIARVGQHRSADWNRAKRRGISRMEWSAN
jgi:hypothetical protein